jgi:hypothetical protein
MVILALFHLDIMDAVVTPFGDLGRVETGISEGLPSELAERFVVEWGAADAEDGGAAVPTLGEELVDGGEQLAPREVAGGSEDDEELSVAHAL